jgi:hypothetical protein
MASITLTRKSQSFVVPAAAPSGEMLELSAIDRVPGLRHTVRSLHVFRNGSRRVDSSATARPAEVIRAALSRALVEYPAFAGRFIGSLAAGEACVACTGDGGWFIDAAADCSLEDVNGLDYPLMICEEELLPAPEEGVDPASIPVMMQVCTPSYHHGFLYASGIRYLGMIVDFSCYKLMLTITLWLGNP